MGLDINKLKVDLDITCDEVNYKEIEEYLTILDNTKENHKKLILSVIHHISDELLQDMITNILRNTNSKIDEQELVTIKFTISDPYIYEGLSLETIKTPDNKYTCIFSSGLNYYDFCIGYLKTEQLINLISTKGQELYKCELSFNNNKSLENFINYFQLQQESYPNNRCYCEREIPFMSIKELNNAIKDRLEEFSLTVVNIDPTEPDDTSYQYELYVTIKNPLS